MWVWQCWPGSQEELSKLQADGCRPADTLRSSRWHASQSGHIHETVASTARKLLSF